MIYKPTESELNTRLLSAIIYNDITYVTNKFRTNPNTIIIDEKYAIIEAVLAKAYDTIEYVFKHGYIGKSTTFSTVFDIAVKNNDEPMVLLILQYMNTLLSVDNKGKYLMFDEVIAMALTYIFKNGIDLKIVDHIINYCKLYNDELKECTILRSLSPNTLFQLSKRTMSVTTNCRILLTLRIMCLFESKIGAINFDNYICFIKYAYKADISDEMREKIVSETLTVRNHRPRKINNIYIWVTALNAPTRKRCASQTD